MSRLIIIISTMILTLLFGITESGEVEAAEQTIVEKYREGEKGWYNVGWECSSCSNNYGYVQPIKLVFDNHIKLEYLKIRVKPKSIGARRVQLCLDEPNRCYSNYAGYLGDFSLEDVDNKNPWKVLEFNISDTHAGRNIISAIIFGQRYDGKFYVDIELLELRYKKYTWDKIEIKLTPEKYVQFYFDRGANLRNGIFKITNITDGNRIVYNGVNTNSVRTYTFLDTQVQPGRVYRYRVEYSTFYSDNMTTLWFDYIEVPDSATEAKIAAEQARNIIMSTLEVSSASDGNVKTKTINIDGQNRYFVDLQATFNNVFNEISKSAKVADLNNLRTSLNNDFANFKNQVNSSLSSLQSGINTDIFNLKNDIDNLKSEISNIHNTVTNINQFIAPTLTKVSGSNGATATQNSSFIVQLDYTNATEYRYKINNQSWSGWSSLSEDGKVIVSGLTHGLNTIYVEIRNGTDENAPVAKGSMTVFRVD